MKHIAFLIYFALTAFGASAQLLPFQNTYEKYSPMWDVTNVYRQVSTSTNLGTQIDTFKGTTGYLWTATFGTTARGTDTFTASPINGTGSITFTFNALKAGIVATATPTVIVTPEHSATGVTGSFAPIPGQTSYTLNPTSKTTTANGSFTLTYKTNRFYRLKFACTDTAAVQANWFFLQDYTLGNR